MAHHGLRLLESRCAVILWLPFAVNALRRLIPFLRECRLQKAQVPMVPQALKIKLPSSAQERQAHPKALLYLLRACAQYVGSSPQAKHAADARHANTAQQNASARIGRLTKDYASQLENRNRFDVARAISLSKLPGWGGRILT